MHDDLLKSGEWGEEIAARYLINLGYTILHRNFRAMRGEIDIIALKHQTVVFVEVKSSAKRGGIPPEIRINRAKQRQLYQIANFYISLHTEKDREYRMDVVAVAGSPDNYQLQHFKNAFYLL